MDRCSLLSDFVHKALRPNMEHLPTLIKIIEGGVTANKEKTTSYAKLLAQKLEEEGNSKAADTILKVADGLQKRGTYKTAFTEALNPMPVDRDSRHTLADETAPELSTVNIQLEPRIQDSVEEFISFILHSQKLIEAGVGINPSMIMYGPPGCGKTELAKWVAAKLDLPLLTARCDSLMSSLLGSTAKNIRNLFTHASNRPCILFLDEFDALAKARDDQHEVGELKRVVVSLLQNIDQLPPETVVLAATNHEKLLDPAIWRRFNYRLHIQLPSETLREKLISQFLGNYKPNYTKNIIQASEGLSGALIKQVCQGAVRAAIINDKDSIDEYKLLAKIAVLRYESIIDSDQPIENKIKELKTINGKFFTLRVLSCIFSISTGKISNIINS